MSVGVDPPRLLDRKRFGARSNALDTEGASIKTNRLEFGTETQSLDSRKLPILARLRPLNSNLTPTSLMFGMILSKDSNNLWNNLT